MRVFEPKRVFAGFFASLLLMGSQLPVAHADDDKDRDRERGRICSVAAYDFHWSGQFAGFIVNGSFSYDERMVPGNGIVREEDLLSFEVSFYDPQGNLLRTYEDNHDKDRYPTFNFAFDTLTKEILQDGTWKVDDDNRRFRNGFLMGEGNPDLRKQPGSQVGLAFWTRPSDDKVPHLHVDDWDLDNGIAGAGEFGFPIGFSSHEDASFLYKTTQERAGTGKIGKTYFDAANGVNELATDLEAFGPRVKVVPATRSARDLRKYLKKCRGGRG